MAFVIRPLRHEDLDRIYPAGEEEQIRKFTYAKRHWPQDMHRKHWAVDEATGAWLLLLPAGRDDHLWRYMFGLDDGVVILRNEGYCLYSFMYVSPPLAARTDEVKDLIREAFKVGGELLDGTTDVTSTSAVPNALFTE